MTEATPQEAKTPLVLFIGKTAVDGTLYGDEWLGFISGNAANAARAAALGKREDKPVRIAAITTLGALVDDEIHRNMRQKFTDSGIEVYSHERSRGFLHVYMPGVSSLDEESNPRRLEERNFAFNPLEIPGVRELTPNVIVIGGGLATDPRTSKNLVALAQYFHDKGSPDKPGPLIIFDAVRKPDDLSHIDELVSLAHITKMSQSLLRDVWGAPEKDGKNNDILSVNKILRGAKEDGQGNKTESEKNLIIVTDTGSLSAKMYWKQEGSIHIPYTEKVEVKRRDPKTGVETLEKETRNQVIRDTAESTRQRVFRSGWEGPSKVKAEEFFSGGVALELAESRITPTTFTEGLRNSDIIEQIGSRAVGVQVDGMKIFGKPIEEQEPIIRTRSRWVLPKSILSDQPHQ